MPSLRLTKLESRSPIVAANATTVPTFQLSPINTAPSTVSGWAQIYVDTSDGNLKVKFGDGIVKTIVTDT
jgi:hypothetical protein